MNADRAEDGEEAGVALGDAAVEAVVGVEALAAQPDVERADQQDQEDDRERPVQREDGSTA